jgi:hypothetical protein
MGGFIDLGVDLIKGGMEIYGVSDNAIFMPGNVDPTAGLSADYQRQPRNQRP